jgi:asparagine synthase (glutamine-hydrolysing)
MCGIFGIIQKDLSSEQVFSATQSIKHRGPDDEGYLLLKSLEDFGVECSGPDTLADLNLPVIQSTYSERFSIGFGFRRLSILDLSKNGHQPMPDSSKNVWIIFNGEIYNYLEIKQDLIHLGHSFRSTSDSEVILHSYLEWGTACFKKFIGMFSIAILDKQKPGLILARDHFGIKPLYYSFQNNTFAFASEIKALLTIPWVPREANMTSITKYLAFGVSDIFPDTAFSAVKTLQPGHFLVINPSNPLTIKEECFWEFRHNPDFAKLSFQDAAGVFRELFDENINIHMRSDVPVGISLSGGLDSTAIIESIHTLFPNNPPFHAFSYIADDPILSEEKWIDLVCQDTGAISHKVRSDHADFFGNLSDLVYTLDEPFLGASMFVQNLVFKLARKNNIKVLLDGQGSDEMLGGYVDHDGDLLASLLLANKFSDAAKFLNRLTGSSLARTLKAVIWSVDRLLPPAIKPSMHYFSLQQIFPYMTDQWQKKARGLIPAGMFKNKTTSYPSHGILNNQLINEVFISGLPALLRFEDRNSMAHSVESRVPFLTPRLAEFCLSLPETYRISPSGFSKQILRSSLEGRIPSQIQMRKDKIGYAPPEKKWMGGDNSKIGEILSSPVSKRIPFYDQKKAISWYEQTLKVGKFDRKVWFLINTILWAERFDVTFPDFEESNY